MGLATLQAYGLAVSLEAGELVTDPGLFFRMSCLVTLVGGTMFLMWLGEQITARGIGNGISLIILVGIIAEVPAALAQFFASGPLGRISPAVIVGVIVMVVVTIAFVVFMERALRKIHIQYPRRQVGMKVMEGQSSHLPVKSQSRRRDPCDLCQFTAAVADDCQHVLGQSNRSDYVDHPRIFRPRTAALSGFLCGDGGVLCIFLHLQRLV